MMSTTAWCPNCLFSIAVFALFVNTGNYLEGQETKSPGDSTDGWVALFNGEDLAGWEQKNGTATYTVVEGTILGKTAAGSPNSFLCTKQSFRDFELTFDVKVDNGLNSGVQIRSKTKDLDAQQESAGQKWGRVFGPQVEIEMSGQGGAQAGYIYGEATGRGWLTPEDRLKPHKHFIDGDWNSYRVLARGARIQTWINGQPIEDLTDEPAFESHPVGFIGLQVHSVAGQSGPFQVQWRNIKIRELKDPVSHSFLGVGAANRIVIVNERGEVEWKLDRPASDGWVLENGNVLLALYRHSTGKWQYLGGLYERQPRGRI